MKNTAEKIMQALSLLRDQLDELERLIERKAREHSLTESHLLELKQRLIIEQEILLRGIQKLEGGK